MDKMSGRGKTGEVLLSVLGSGKENTNVIMIINVENFPPARASTPVPFSFLTAFEKTDQLAPATSSAGVPLFLSPPSCFLRIQHDKKNQIMSVPLIYTDTKHTLIPWLIHTDYVNNRPRIIATEQLLVRQDTMRRYRFPKNLLLNLQFVAWSLFGV